MNVYQAGAWHDFCIHEKFHVESNTCYIIPEDVQENNIFAQTEGSRKKMFLRIHELVNSYAKKVHGRIVLSSHIIESIISSIISENSAGYLYIEKYRQSYVKALADFINSFRSSTLLGLRQAITDIKGERLSGKDEDLISIYNEYEKRLPQYGFDLRYGMELLLNEKGTIDISNALGIKEYDKITFLGFDCMNSVDQEFVKLVAENVTDTEFLFCYEPEASIQPMHVRGSIRGMLNKLENCTSRYEVLLPAEHNIFVDISKNIFNSADKTEIKQGNVHIFNANNRFMEIVEVSRKIRGLLDDGVASGSIRVVAPQYRIYSEIAYEVFPEYNIPFTLEKGIPLLHFPLALLIFNMVNHGVSSNPYPLREKIFSSPYTGFCEKIEQYDLEDFQKTASVELLPEKKLGSVFKPGTYCLEFNYIKNIQKKAWKNISPVSGTSQMEVVRLYINGLIWDSAEEKENCLCRCLIQFYLMSRAEKALSVWKPAMEVARFVEAVEYLIKRFEIQNNIEKDITDTDDILQDCIKKELQVLDGIYGLLGKMPLVLNTSKLDSSKADKLSLAELTRAFLGLMNDESLPVKENADTPCDPISFQDIGARGFRRWDYTFVCGVVDGEFPAEDDYNFLKPEKDGMGAGQPYNTLDHERSHLYNLIRSTSVSLYLSAPLSDNGRKLPSSPFISEIEKCIKCVDKPDILSKKPYNLREKMLFIGKHVDQNYEKAEPILNEIRNDDNRLWLDITDILRYDGLTMRTGYFSEYDGLFSADRSLSISSFLKDEIRNITFTPETLERYTGCPMRFFLDDIMNLKTGVDHDPDKSETGLIIRSILKKYTEHICERQVDSTDVSLLISELIKEYSERVEQQGADVFKTLFVKRLAAGLNDMPFRRPGLFHSFLEYEKNGPDYLTPYLPGIKGTIKPCEGCEIHVETDRIDMTEDGRYLLVCFYTIDRPGGIDRIFRGMRFDLPLAVLLCRDFIAENNPGLSVAGAGMYHVKSSKSIRRGDYFAIEDIRAARRNKTSPDNPVFSGQRKGFLKEGEFSQALDEFKGYMVHIYRLINKGVFHLPLCFETEQTCSNCSFSRLCRKDPLRIEKLRNNAASKDEYKDKLHVVYNIFEGRKQ